MRAREFFYRRSPDRLRWKGKEKIGDRDRTTLIRSAVETIGMKRTELTLRLCRKIDAYKIAFSHKSHERILKRIINIIRE